MRSLATTNQRGLSSLTLIVVLPLLLSLLAGSAFFARNLYQWNMMHHQCQSTVLQHQNELRGLLTKLLALNPKAKNLRLQKSMAQVALAAAIATGTPAAIAAAQKRLAQILSKQRLLDSHQKILIGLAQASVQKFKWRARKNLNYNNLKQHQPPGRFTYPLAVEPFPVKATAPVYKPVANFSNKQNIGLSFTWELKDWSFIAGILELPSILKIECGSTLKQENNKWFTHLSVAKPLSRL